MLLKISFLFGLPFFLFFSSFSTNYECIENHVVCVDETIICSQIMERMKFLRSLSHPVSIGTRWVGTGGLWWKLNVQTCQVAYNLFLNLFLRGWKNIDSFRVKESLSKPAFPVKKMSKNAYGCSPFLFLRFS